MGDRGCKSVTNCNFYRRKRGRDVISGSDGVDGEEKAVGGWDLLVSVKESKGRVVRRDGGR